MSPDRWCRLHWGCCAGRWLGQAGYKAQTLPQQAAGPCGQSEACRPALALTAPPPRASPSPTIVVCHTSHAITAMIKATATSHRGHCGDHQFLIGLRLGLHLCYSENFPELLCSQSAPNSPVGAVRIMNQPLLPPPPWPHRRQGWGPPQMSPSPGTWHDFLTCPPQPSASTMSTWPLNLSNFFHGACEPRRRKGIKTTHLMSR